MKNRIKLDDQGTYYVYEFKYIGPNKDTPQNIDADRIEITTLPHENLTGTGLCIEGCCWTRNDWALYAHGQYETIREARSAIKAKFGAVRGTDEFGDKFEPEFDFQVAIFKPGRYMPMCTEKIWERLYYLVHDDMDKDTDKAKIKELAKEYEELVNVFGCTLGPNLIEILEEMKDEYFS